MTDKQCQQNDYFLNITADRCPMTFVKTRLMLDKMASGETLCVRLIGEEPLRNVPRSAKELGHIVSEPVLSSDGVFEIVIKKI